MALRDYNMPITPVKKKLNVVICIYQKNGIGIKSPVNKALAEIQTELKRELRADGKGLYESINVAYVFENRGYLCAKPFEELRPDTPIQYKEIYEKTAHNLAHVFYMGLVMLERESRKEDTVTENRFYLVADDVFTQPYVDRIVQESRSDEDYDAEDLDDDGSDSSSTDNIEIIERFSEIYKESRFYLYSKGNTGDRRLEKLFHHKSKI